MSLVSIGNHLKSKGGLLPYNLLGDSQVKQESQQGIDIEDAVQKINSAVLRAATLKPNAHKLKSRNISIDEIYRCLEGNYTKPITVLRTDAFEPSK